MDITTDSPLNGIRICFYGAGSMAEALLRGLLEAELISPDRMTVMNRRNASRLSELQQRYGVIPAATEHAKQDALHLADVIVLGMKPADSAAAIRQLAPVLRPEQLIVSLIAGLSIGTIHRLLGSENAVARTMPNTSSTISLGATGISFSSGVTDRQRELALSMFGAVGITAVIDEPLMESVTGVSGSGPAYVYYFMEAMIASAVELGFSPEVARELTVQTVRGAAEMVRLTGEAPADLRKKVTSPGGTTQAAIEVLEKNLFQETVKAAIFRAAERAKEMGEAIRKETESATAAND